VQVAEKHIVEKIRALSEKEREDVLRYVDRMLNSHAAKQRLGEKLVDLVADIPDEVWERIPDDGSEQHDHYIYGTQKR
jgi:hypothetical protein